MNQIEFFKSLSDQTRLDIVTLLVLHGEICVCDLMSALDLSQPKISRHLAVLRNAKILQDRRQGQWIYYQIHPELAAWCLEILKTSAQQNTRVNEFKIALNRAICCE